MACNKDSGCLEIARTTYPGLRSDIDSSFESINSGLNEIIDGLSGLSTPDDYLGAKIQERLTAIASSFSESAASAASAQSGIDVFIDGKIEEHQEHYDEWKRQQELLNETDEDDDDEEDEDE